MTKFGLLSNNGESDRARVILAASNLDAMLCLLLSKFLRPITGNKDKLLDGNSPLGTFSSRINVAHRLGLINSQLTKALHLIRKISNSFAHEIKGDPLKSGPHSDRIRELLSLVNNHQGYHEFKKAFLKDGEGEDIDLHMVLSLIAIRLDSAIHYSATIDTDNECGLIPTGWDKPEETNEKLAAKLKTEPGTSKKVEGKSKEVKEVIDKEEQYCSLDNMMEGIQIIDRDWRYTYLNDSAASHGGFPKKELLGHTMMEKYPGIENTEMFRLLQTCLKDGISPPLAP